MLDVIWITLAFGLGLLSRQIGLPPLVGYLIAGFILAGFGVQADDVIREFEEMGVTLLLFTIGLKLKLDSLAKPQIWGVASLHMATVVLLFVPAFLGLGALGLPYFTDLDATTAAVLAFSLSFSSTVFAVKVLEDKGEMGSFYGILAIGILIIQDLVAVIFLAVSAGKIPTLWALLLFGALFPMRYWYIKALFAGAFISLVGEPAFDWLFALMPIGINAAPIALLKVAFALLAFVSLPAVLGRLLERSGHGELLVLLALALGIGGAQLFDMVSVKGDLGALLLGVVIASHPKSKELGRALLNFKDVFLVGFFLSIGLKGIPTPEMILVALVLLIAVPLKGWLFYRLLLRFNLRARTSFLTSAALANFSEFGLIVAAIGATNGWFSDSWLTIVAVALSLSFVAASPLNTFAHQIYERYSGWLRRLQHPNRLPEEAEIDPGDVNVMIFGMGRVGTGAYDSMQHEEGRNPIGIDLSPDKVTQHKEAGRNVILGSATDPDFWNRLKYHDSSIELVLLAMPKVSENIFAAEHLVRNGYQGVIGAIAKFPDDEPALEQSGVQMVFNLYDEAGAGFAQHISNNAAANTQTA